MEKKSIIIILLLLLVVAFSLIYTQFHKENEVKIDEITFSLPEGYSVGNNSSNIINITNGTNTFFIRSFNENNSTKLINEYKTYKMNEFNETVNISDFKIDNITIYKSHLSKDKKNFHYWFKNNNKTYTIYTWDADKNVDSIITELIKSIH